MASGGGGTLSLSASPSSSSLPVNQIIQGHTLDALKGFPDNSVDMVFTSPPYFGLRTYTDDPLEIGRESRMHDYIRSLVEVSREIKRVLKPTGSYFLNIGDTYNGDKAGTTNGLADQGSTIGAQKKGAVEANQRVDKVRQSGIPDKCLLGIPQRLRIALTDELGLCLRNEIIWNKPNAMPSWSLDRWTSSHEYIFFFTKEPTGSYFETQYEPFRSGDYAPGSVVSSVFGGSKKHRGYGSKAYSGKPWYPQTEIGGRIVRDVWTFTTQPRRDAHFATFPDELPKRAILATCPEYICKKCGFMRQREYKRVEVATAAATAEDNDKDNNDTTTTTTADNNKKRPKTIRVPTGKLTSCTCGAGWRPGVVLDPFSGRGTTCIIARQLGRDSIGVDLNPEFCVIARNNLEVLMKQDNLTRHLH